MINKLLATSDKVHYQSTTIDTTAIRNLSTGLVPLWGYDANTKSCRSNFLLSFSAPAIPNLLDIKCHSIQRSHLIR